MKLYSTLPLDGVEEVIGEPGLLGLDLVGS